MNLSDIPISTRDQLALDEATSSGALTVPDADAVPALTPFQAVVLSLARHIARVEGVVVDELGSSVIQFVEINDIWPNDADPSHYPSASILPQITREGDAVTCVPFVYNDEDVVTDTHALWKLGEDTGIAIIHVFATSINERDAMLAAVKQALYGALDRLQGLTLPLPEASLPPPFIGQLPIERLPHAYVRHIEGSGTLNDALPSTAGIWRGDLSFQWQAPRWAMRPRLPDLHIDIQAQTIPGEET